MASVPLVTIGMPVFNGEKYIRKALDSLLAQTFPDFEIIISDNASTDATLQICKEYAALDRRITVFENGQNLGSWRNFHIVFEKGRGEYFMWAADHDLWHTECLQAYVEILDKFPEVVMAYSMAVAISADGEVLPIKAHQFDTFGLSKIERARAASKRMIGAGNMVYGLFRRSTLARCGVYRRYTMPDRLLLLEMSVYGSFKQIERELWYRRYPEYPKRVPLPEGGVPPDYEQVLTRQIEILFPDGAPWHTRFPLLSNAFAIIYHLTFMPVGGNYSNVHLGPYMAYMHLNRKRSFVREETSLFIRQMLRRLVRR